MGEMGRRVKELELKERIALLEAAGVVGVVHLEEILHLVLVVPARDHRLHELEAAECSAPVRVVEVEKACDFL